MKNKIEEICDDIELKFFIEVYEPKLKTINIIFEKIEKEHERYIKNIRRCFNKSRPDI